MNMEDGVGGAVDQFLCCLAQKENGHALTFHYSSIEGALNTDIHAENCEYIVSFNAR